MSLARSKSGTNSLAERCLARPTTCGPRGTAILTLCWRFCSPVKGTFHHVFLQVYTCPLLRAVGYRPSAGACIRGTTVLAMERHMDKYLADLPADAEYDND